MFLEPGSPTMEEARVRWSHEPGGTHEGLFQICGSTDEEAAGSAWGRPGSEGGVPRREGSI